MAAIDHKIPLCKEFYSNTYTKHRRAKAILFNDCLSKTQQYIDLSYDDKMSLLQLLERSCYNYTINKASDENIMATWSNDLFCDLYHSICYKISSNIDASNEINNVYLINAILNKTIDINLIPNMTSQELFPSQYTAILERVAISKNVVQSIKTSAMYRCSKCKQNKCTLENRFNRSLDEGVNLTITCMNCMHSWNA
jgi:hypothetical protein